MCPCNKFHSIWRTLDFSTKLVQKNMTDKTFEKNKHQFGERHIFRPNLTKENMNDKNLEKINIKLVCTKF